jgi:hypothetical protein
MIRNHNEIRNGSKSLMIVFALTFKTKDQSLLSNFFWKITQKNWIEM